MRKLVMIVSMLVAASAAALAQAKEQTVVMKIFPGTTVPEEELGKKLGENPDIKSFEINAATRLVKIAWKKDYGDAFKLEKFFEEASVPAVMWNPLRIPATATGDATYKALADALKKVKGMTRVDELKNGVLMWAEPTIDLDVVNKVATDAKMSLNINTHEKMVLNYENKGNRDTAEIVAELNHVGGVIRIDHDEQAKSITVLHKLGWSVRAQLPALAHRRGFTVFEKTK